MDKQGHLEELAYKKGYIEGLRDSQEYTLLDSQFQVGVLPKYTLSPFTSPVASIRDGRGSK